MQTAADLRNLLNKIDHRGYPAYKDTKGTYQFPGYVLSIDHVQGDPFASPSKVSVIVKGRTADFPKELYIQTHLRTALQDELTRQFGRQAEQFAFKAKGSGKSGLISLSRPGQEVLERTCCQIEPKTGDITVRMEIGFPANGRTVNARELEKIFFQYLPSCVQETLYYKNLDIRKLENVMELSEDQEAIRRQLKEYGLVAFVADGSVLPRMSGVSQKPRKDAVPLVSPESVRVTLTLPYYGEISGMGIRRGITLIVGGGYHGKSTLLKALEMGIYPHIAGDGREYVITDPDAVKIRAEDGRSVKHTDISMFISDLPNQKDTVSFDTEDASGSTSQAANVIEAMEAGASTFLIDEDTSATNFMVRDELMQKVIHKDMEPITPFIERMQYFYKKFGISTVLVAGSSGAYFQVADVIVQMDRYQPREITSRAKEATAGYQGLQFLEKEIQKPIMKRCPKKNTGLEHRGRIKLKTLGKDGIMLGSETIDLRYVEQVADEEQLNCLGYLMRELETHRMNGKTSICELVESLYRDIERQGLKDVLGERELPGNLALPRKEELCACLNRYRGLQL